jgi:hypothetical protein
MEKEHVERLAALYKKAQAASDPKMAAIVEGAMTNLLHAESAVTSMMVAESVAIEVLERGDQPGPK